MATLATAANDLNVKRRQRSWKDPEGYQTQFARAEGPITSPCHAAWRNAAHRKHVIVWLEDGVGLQLTLIVHYMGMDRYAVFHREKRQMPDGQRMVVAVDHVSGDIFCGRPEC